MRLVLTPYQRSSAPARIQASRRSTAAASGCGSSGGGMCSSSSSGRQRRRRSSLAAGSPGTITGPLMLPAATPSGVCSARRAFCFDGPWHLAQWLAKSGAISASKVEPAGAAAGGAVLARFLGGVGGLGAAAGLELEVARAVRQGRAPVARGDRDRERQQERDLVGARALGARRGRRDAQEHGQRHAGPAVAEERLARVPIPGQEPAAGGREKARQRDEDGELAAVRELAPPERAPQLEQRQRRRRAERRMQDQRVQAAEELEQVVHGEAENRRAARPLEVAADGSRLQRMRPEHRPRAPGPAGGLGSRARPSITCRGSDARTTSPGPGLSGPDRSAVPRCAGPPACRRHPRVGDLPRARRVGDRLRHAPRQARPRGRPAVARTSSSRATPPRWSPATSSS